MIRILRITSSHDQYSLSASLERASLRKAYGALHALQQNILWRRKFVQRFVMLSINNTLLEINKEKLFSTPCWSSFRELVRCWRLINEFWFHLWQTFRAIRKNENLKLDFVLKVYKTRKVVCLEIFPLRTTLYTQRNFEDLLHFQHSLPTKYLVSFQSDLIQPNIESFLHNFLQRIFLENSIFLQIAHKGTFASLHYVSKWWWWYDWVGVSIQDVLVRNNLTQQILMIYSLLRLLQFASILTMFPLNQAIQLIDT